MNAHKLVAEKGIEEAKRILKLAPENSNYRYYSVDIGNSNSGWHVDYRANCIDLTELKQIVESVDLIESYGGITKAKACMTRYFKLNAAFRNDYPKTGNCITQQMIALQNAIAHAEK